MKRSNLVREQRDVVAAIVFRAREERTTDGVRSRSSLKIFRARARRARTQHRTRREHHTRLEERAFTRWTRAGASSRGHDHRSRVGVCGAARRGERGGWTASGFSFRSFHGVGLSKVS